MRTALVTILIVLQHAAQLPCRSVTRGALRASLHAAPASSQEDLETIIARNREITDLLIPLLEANLEAKRNDQNKRNDLLKVFPYRDVSKPIKDPLVELLPLIKRKSTGKAPLALILASELRSQKNKKGKSKVHARKAFLIENEEKDDSSEADEYITSNSRDESTLNENTTEDEEPNKIKEDYDIDIGSTHKSTVEVSESKSSEVDYDTVNKSQYENQLNLSNNSENKNTVEANSSEEDYDVDIKRKTKLVSSNSNENKITLEASESDSSEVEYDIDITSEDKHVKKNDLTKETQEESGNITVEDKKLVQKKNYKRPKRVRLNNKLVKSNSDEHDVIQSSEIIDYDVDENKIKLNSQSDKKSEDQASDGTENKPEDHKIALTNSAENSVEFAGNSNESINGYKQKYQISDTDSYKVSKELAIDVSKEYARNGKHVKVSKHYQKHRDNNSTSEENNNSKLYSKSDETYDTNENSQSEKGSEEDSSSENSSGNEYVSIENENAVVISNRPSDRVIINTSEENIISEDQDAELVPNQYNNYIKNKKNSFNEPDRYISEYDVSHSHDIEPYEQVYDDYEQYTDEENDQYTSYEDVSDGENYNSLYDEYENYSEDDFNENDTEYVESEDDIQTGMIVESSESDIESGMIVESSEDDIETGMNVESSEDDIETEMTIESSEDDTPVEDDDYTDEWIDDAYDSFESRKAPNKESIEVEKQVTFSQEIAGKYANDSKYTVEDDHSFVESSGELGKFNVESVEGLIEVLQQDQENKENECQDTENHENTPDEKDSDGHTHDVHKSYKLSFKFNK